MNAYLKLLAITVFGFYSLTGAAAPQGGVYQAGKILSKSISPPEAPCDMFLPSRKQIIFGTKGAYRLIPTFEGSWTQEPFEGPAYDCKLNGAVGTCAIRSSFDVDLSSDGLNAVLTFTDHTGEKNQWTGDGKFQNHQNSQISCKGSDCEMILGSAQQCTMNIVMEYNRATSSY